MAAGNIYQMHLECAQCQLSFDCTRRMLDGGMGVTEYQLKNQPKKLAAYVPVRFANASWIMVVNAPYEARIHQPDRRSDGCVVAGGKRSQRPALRAIEVPG